jgi:hypothetical protein
MEELLAQIDQVGLVAKHLITVIKFSHLGKDYAPDEKRAACDALDAGLAALKVSSAADGAATEERMPRAQTLGVMLAAKLDSDFYEALENGKHWEDNKERQRLRANLKVFFHGCNVHTPEELHSGPYATRAAVEEATAMLRGQAAVLTKCYKDQFDLGTDANAMLAAVRRAVTHVLPQVWLEAYDLVRPSPSPHPTQGRVARRARAAWRPVHGTRMHDARMPRRR